MEARLPDDLSYQTAAVQARCPRPPFPKGGRFHVSITSTPKVCRLMFFVYAILGPETLNSTYFRGPSILHRVARVPDME